MDDVHAEHGGCEYVEYPKGQSRAAVPSVRHGRNSDLSQRTGLASKWMRAPFVFSAACPAISQIITYYLDTHFGASDDGPTADHIGVDVQISVGLSLVSGHVRQKDTLDWIHQICCSTGMF